MAIPTIDTSGGPSFTQNVAAGAMPVFFQNTLPGDLVIVAICSGGNLGVLSAAIPDVLAVSLGGIAFDKVQFAIPTEMDVQSFARTSGGSPMLNGPRGMKIELWIGYISNTVPNGEIVVEWGPDAVGQFATQIGWLAIAGANGAAPLDNGANMPAALADTGNGVLPINTLFASDLLIYARVDAIDKQTNAFDSATANIISNVAWTSTAIQGGNITGGASGSWGPAFGLAIAPAVTPNGKGTIGGFSAEYINAGGAQNSEIALGIAASSGSWTEQIIINVNAAITLPCNPCCQMSTKLVI
jgi:hypothetical protein